MRFRKHKYVIMADVEKMYRQVLVDKEDQDLQRIIWRSNPNEPLSKYRLCTVTYGTASASFLVTRCLKQLAIENCDKYPNACKAISQDFYVDDLITGGETVAEISKLQIEISKILLQA